MSSRQVAGRLFASPHENDEGDSVPRGGRGLLLALVLEPALVLELALVPVHDWIPLTSIPTTSMTTRR